MAKQKEHIKTAGEVLDQLTKMVKEHGRDKEFVLTVPFRNGIGLHYEYPVNITFAGGLIDMHITRPQDDDVEKPRHRQ